MKQIVVNEIVCNGCGKSINAVRWKSWQWSPQRVIAPVNSIHRTGMFAIERGDLQNMIFDNRVLRNHCALAAVL
jgi:hypothetical protein